MNEVVFRAVRPIKTILIVDGGGFRPSVWLSLNTGVYHLIIADSGAAALQMEREYKGPIDLLLANVEMPDMSGIELAERLRRSRPGIKILLLSSLHSGMLALTRGWQFLPTPFEAEMFRTIILDMLKELPISSLEQLTKREIEVLKLIAEGYSTKQVAATLGIAFKTAIGHRSLLMQKLQIHDLATLVRYAIRMGLVNP